MSDMERANKIVSELHTRFPGILEHFREVLTRKIVEVLCEAHERGRQEGFKQALKEIELKRHGFLSVDQAHELAETIRTAMEGK